MMLWRRRPWRLGWRRARFPGGGDGTMLGEGLPMVFQRGNLGRRCDDVRAQGQRQRWRTKISSIGSGRLRAQGPRSTPFYAARTRHLRPVPPCASSRTQDGPARAIAELVKKRTGVAREDVAAPFPISPSPDGSYSKLLFVDGEQGPHKQCALWPPIATALSPRVLLLSPCKVLARFRDNGIQSSLESLELNHTNGTVALLQIVSTAPLEFGSHRPCWYMAYIMDTNEEERLKGKTVEVGRAHFETENTRFTILDAPGHKCYIPNMIASASQADIGVLVISARKGEFEAGYESGGQTREHVLLAKTLGVAKLIVVINKMDEPTVQWSKERYDEIEGKMVPFLKSSGYNVKKDVQFLPISGLCGTNMKNKMDKSICSWWDGPCLFDVLDHIEVPLCDHKGSVRMPIIGKYKDHGTVGTVLIGKLESGTITEGDSLLVMPNKSNVKVIGISLDERKVRRAGPGENVCVKLNGIEEEDIMGGFVLSSISKCILPKMLI
ncbi:hypothetical protein QYE76_000272 [Lolium multiflorum]|uniref:Tr-type G domain-containing protein n=1 Tax=Lolium multiflorum TaxID=4521 RepID=A0AAD8RJX8_LOLMU|nr:hypothetical protein QYE76_000272 [Lolium multiflorum]